QQGAPSGKSAARRLGLGELLSGDGPGGAVRRLQDERLWPRVRQAARRGVSQCQGGLDQDGLTLRSMHGTVAVLAAAVFLAFCRLLRSTDVGAQRLQFLADSA